MAHGLPGEPGVGDTAELEKLKAENERLGSNYIATTNLVALARKELGELHESHERLVEALQRYVDSDGYEDEIKDQARAALAQIADSQ